jgi:transcriptional regulator with PAS, ATPase and Fis domain
MSDETPSLAGSVPRRRATAAALLVVVVAAVASYAFHERNVARQLAEQNSAVTSTLNATRDQMNAVSARLDAMNAERQAEKPAPTHSAIHRKPLTAAGTRHRIDDPRWKKVQGQLDEQAKQIDSTREDLTNTRTELQGSIATTHEELVILEKKGERSYYEFDLDKSGQIQREGPVGVRLRKANSKHEYADLEILVDDFKVSKNHVNIFEPVVFYSGDRKLPVELVINSIGRNHIHGYISEPKYKVAELEAMANTSANNKATSTNPLDTALPAKPSPARQRLEPPK